MSGLEKFRLLKEDDNQYHLASPNGKKFAVDKSGLSENAHSVVKSLVGKRQKFDDGGMAADDRPLDIEQVADGDVGADDTAARAPAASQPQDAAVDAAPQAQDPLIQNRAGENALLNKGQQDIQAAYNAEQASGAEGVAAQNKYIKQLEGMPTPLDIAASNKAKDDSLLQAATSGHIDPDRMWHNMGTGSKVLASIGLILGGIGAPATGGRNLALDTLNGAIDKDVESQKYDLSNKMNLYNMNLQAEGRSDLATLRTQNQLATIAQAKMAKAQAGAVQPAAKLRMQQAIDELEAKKNQNRMRMGLLGQNSGEPGARAGASGANPLDVIGSLNLSPEDKKASIKEVSDAQHVAKNETRMIELFDQASKENTVLRTGAGYLRTPESILALDALGDPLIHEQDGRVNEFEKADYKGLQPRPGDTEDKIARKRIDFKRFIEGKASAPTFRAATGMDIKNFISTNPESNPNNMEHKPGTVIEIKGRPGQYLVGQDGNSLTLVK